MNIRTEKYTFLACYASALINNDFSSTELNESDHDAIRYILNNLGQPVDCSETWFGFCEQTLQNGTVCEYSFLFDDETGKNLSMAYL